ncbi:hypothetical protein ACFFUE_07590 [Bergeyella porcorum]|uniref:hypothetical protein n=1 Tax=Bergeyella porcorum TaxID=1735111 RepID=UPI0035EBDE7A
MKKIITSSFVLASVLAHAQEGTVGINTMNPKATLEVQPSTVNLTGTTNEGLLIPRLSKERVAKMANPETSTLVYVNEATTYTTGTDTAADTRVENIDAVGFYHYNGTQWVKHLDTNDSEWVYDADTNRVNLKRSGSGDFKNKVFYDIQTGQLVNIDDEQNIRELEFMANDSSVSVVEKIKTLDEKERYRNYTYTETKNMPISKNINGTGVTYKRMSSANMTVSSGETVPHIQGDVNYINVPLDNSNDYTSFYNLGREINLFGSGSIVNAAASSSAVRTGNGHISNFVTGHLSTVGVYGTGSSNLVRASFNRIQFQSSEGAMVDSSAAGFFGSESASFDNTLIKNYNGIQISSFNNSKNSGEGIYMAGIHNNITLNTKTKYNDMYGIYTRSAVITETATKPTNNYGLYIADVTGGETLNRAIHTEAGKIRFGDLANTSATADRVVTVDRDGVLKTGETVTNTVKLATTTSVTCDATTTGTMNFGTVTINSNQTEAFGFCMKNSAGEYKWYYIYGGAGITTGSGAFGTGL